MRENDHLHVSSGGALADVFQHDAFPPHVEEVALLLLLLSGTRDKCSMAAR